MRSAYFKTGFNRLDVTITLLDIITHNTTAAICSILYMANILILNRVNRAHGTCLGCRCDNRANDDFISYIIMHECQVIYVCVCPHSVPLFSQSLLTILLHIYFV